MTDCTEWITFDLSGERLIGFTVVLSDQDTDQRNIRAIRPIFDSPSCIDTSLILSSIPNSISLVRGKGSETINLDVFDSISSYYYNMDGHSFCGPRVFSLIDAPSYLTIDGNSLTITSNSIDDVLQEHAVILRVSLSDYQELQYQEITIHASIDCP